MSVKDTRMLLLFVELIERNAFGIDHLTQGVHIGTDQIYLIDAID